MNSSIATWRSVARALCVSALMLTAASQAQAQQATPAASESQIKARAILMQMAEFLGGTQNFSVSVRAAYDAVQKSGQKIEFGETRKLSVSRPDRMRVESEQSDGAKTLTVFSGKEIVLVDSTANVYATAPQTGSLDQTLIHFVKDLGMRFPMAALLVSQLPQELEGRVKSVDYVEKTSIYGAPAHHLAARTDTVDVQIWVADGDKPLPQRIILTYQKAAGQPQFWAQFSDWNLAPAITDATFAAQVPEGAQKIAFATQLPRLSPAASKAAAKKGAK